MTDLPPDDGWWKASDGNWYSPEQLPGPVPETAALEATHVAAGVSAAPNVQGYGAAPVPHGYGLPQIPPRFGLPSLPPGYGPPLAPPGTGFSYGYPATLPPGFPDQALPKTNGLAVASLVCSFFFWLFGIGAVLGIVFGFVSRSQIKHSAGIQRGKGMALAGIIIGFASFLLILPAIAIPTFLGVRAADLRARAAESIPVKHLSPTPIALGVPEGGSPNNPITWESRSLGGATLAAVPGGVNMTIPARGQSYWAVVPVDYEYQSIQLSASAGIVAGSRSNGTGLGCASRGLANQVQFFVYRTGLWQLIGSTRTYNAILDSGTSTAVNQSGANLLTIACRNVVAEPGSVAVSFEVNGIPVASDVVGLAASDWVPTIQMCSCAGPDTGSFLNARYYASVDS